MGWHVSTGATLDAVGAGAVGAWPQAVSRAARRAALKNVGPSKFAMVFGGRSVISHGGIKLFFKQTEVDVFLFDLDISPEFFPGFVPGNPFEFRGAAMWGLFAIP